MAEFKMNSPQEVPNGKDEIVKDHNLSKNNTSDPMADEDIISITVIDREGVEHQIEAPTDMNFNVMEICRASDLPVEGTCGGMALCASCHVYIHSDHQLSEPIEEEEDMLDQAFFVEENSRLCCQIRIEPELDGLKVELAPVGE